MAETIWDMALSSASLAPTSLDGSDPSSSSGDPSALMNDPVLGPILQANPQLLNQMMAGGTSASTSPPTLEEALVGSAMTVTGRKGITGKPFVGQLPPWAKNLGATVLSNPDFDPYFGIVSQSGDERVFMGSRTKTIHTDATVASPHMERDPLTGDYTKTPGDVIPGETKHKQVDKTLTSTQAANLPYTWSDAEVKDAMHRLKKAGLQVDSFDMGSNSLVSVWGALVNRAAMTYAMSEGQRKVSPWDVLDMYKNESSNTSGGSAGFTGSHTTTAKNVTDITEGEAWSSIQSTLSQMLGRDPSDQETRDFTYRMNQLAAKNPSISRTVTDYKNGRAVTSSTHTDPGFTAADMAERAYKTAQNNPDYGEYQAASTYFNAALSALGPIGG